jgi:hypothetical protein
MVKCVNCGSTAQVKQIGRDETDLEVVETFKCGCGCIITQKLKKVSTTHWHPYGITLKTEKF